MRWYFLFLSLTVAVSVFGEICNEHTVPHMFSIDASGEPELRCRRLDCFQIASNLDVLHPHANLWRHSYLPNLNVICSQKYTETVCAGRLEWTNDFSLFTNSTHFGFKSRCCSSELMRSAVLLENVRLTTGEAYIGGTRRNGNNTYVDLIKEIRVVFRSYKNMEYDLMIYRMPCSTVTLSESKLFEGTMRTTENSNTNFETAMNERRQYPRRLAYDIEKRRLAQDKQVRWRPPFNKGKIYYYYYTTDDENLIENDLRNPLPQDDKINPSLHGVPGLRKIKMSLSNLTVPNRLQDGRTFVPSDQFIDLTNIETNTDTRIPDTNTENVAASPHGVLVMPGNYYYGVPAYQYQYPSSEQPTLNSYFDSLQCFSGDMTVETPQGSKAIRDLKIGESVLSAEGSFTSFSPVLMFLHHMKTEPAIFNVIMLENGRKLKVTNYHLIYTNDCSLADVLKLSYAKDLQKGHCLHTHEKGSRGLKAMKISQIERIEEIGIYAPLTASGNIFVNSVLSSCHSNFAFQTLQQTFFLLLKRIERFLGSLGVFNVEDYSFVLPYIVPLIESILV